MHALWARSTQSDMSTDDRVAILERKLFESEQKRAKQRDAARKQVRGMHDTI